MECLMARRATRADEDPVGRTPSSAADPLVGLFIAPASRTRASGADQGVRPTASSAERYDRMRALVQRVTQASVEVDGAVVGQIGPGLLVLLGVAKPDTTTAAEFLARKVLEL